MEEWEGEESLMTDAELEAFMGCSDGLCSFDVPPPPPPWLDTLPGCYGTGNCADTPLVTSVQGGVQDLVQTIAVIVVSSLVIVVTVVLAAAMLYRRWRSGRKEREEATGRDQELSMADKTSGHFGGLAPRSTNLYISEQQLMVEVGRGGELPAPALIIGGVPFHLVQALEEPIYHSIDSEHYSDLSSLGSSGGSVGSGEDPSPRLQGLGPSPWPQGLGPSPPPRLHHLRPHSSQSAVRHPHHPVYAGGSLPAPWRPGRLLPSAPREAGGAPPAGERLREGEGAVTSL